MLSNGASSSDGMAALNSVSVMIGARGPVAGASAAGFWASKGAAALLKYKKAIVRINQAFPGPNAPLCKKVPLGPGTFDSAKGKCCKQERNDGV